MLTGIRRGGSTISAAEPARARLESQRDEAGDLILTLSGRLDSESTGAIWREAMGLTRGQRGHDLVVDATQVDYCDGAGASLLLALNENQAAAGDGFILRGLREEFYQLLEMIRPGEAKAEPAEHRLDFFETLGRASLQVASDVRAFLVFLGELVVTMGYVLRRPSLIRGKDFLLVAERAGIGAIPIVAIVGFLLGLILLFQSAIPMQRFGAQIFAADLLGIAMFRELGPLMAAILLTARSGSAFAAEIGTMKVNEELDALTTMGLEPVRFLVVPRVLAAVLVVPILTMVTSLAGLVGGALVFTSLGFPLVTFVNRVVAAASVTDLVGGLAKSLVLGVIVGGVGCLRGIQTGTGASAVGESTTSSVVTGIILIAIAEGIFAVAFFVLGV
jgi:phospholipid/cholesterol/gamma-HCH transport system permease protein